MQHHAVLIFCRQKISVLIFNMETYKFASTYIKDRYTTFD